MNDYELLKRELDEIKAWKESLEASHSIPLNIYQAFSGRFAFGIGSSTKSASSENQAVNEAGAGTYNVLVPPDAFLKVSINGTIYYLPAYT